MPKPSKTNRVIGDNIFRLRTQQKLTQDGLALLIGIKCTNGGSLISRMESGTNGDPSLKKLRSLAKALDTTVDALLSKHTT